MKRLLIYEHLTGGGMAGEELQASWLDEGQAMRRAAIAAFRQAGCDVVTLQDARLPAEDHTEFLPINHKADLRPALLQMIDQTDHGLLIAPETGGSLAEVVALAQQKPGWHLGCDLNSINLCGDKWQASRFFHEQHIKHPQTWLMNDDSFQWNLLSGNVVTKPRDGAGSLETFLFESSRKNACLNQITSDRTILQKFCEGRSMSLSALCDGRGGVAPIVVFDHNRQLVPVDDWIWEFQCHNPRMMPQNFMNRLEQCQNALRLVAGLRGWVGVDFIWNERSGQETVIEINPRLTMSFAWLHENTGLGGQLARDWLYLMDQSGVCLT